MSDAIKITPRAVEQIHKLRNSLQIGDDQFLRIGVKGGGAGCISVDHVLAFDKKQEQDEVYQVEGIDVLIRKGEGLYVLGMEVDYIEEEHSKGFVFRS